MSDWWNDHSAQVLETYTTDGRRIRHLKVWRDDGKDGIPWDVLQAVKNDLLGKNVAAVEVYPPEYELVNDVNMRHLWEVP